VRLWGRIEALTLAWALAACSVTPRAHLPLQTGWYGGELVYYLTTDVSDAVVARDKGANFAPRLADAVLGAAARAAGQRSAYDKVYALTNFAQPPVFASAPEPVGHSNGDDAYSPLWRMVTVTWAAGRNARLLDSEEAVLAAADQGAVTLTETRVVLNCPIVRRATGAALPGATLHNAPNR